MERFYAVSGMVGDLGYHLKSIEGGTRVVWNILSGSRVTSTENIAHSLLPSVFDRHAVKTLRDTLASILLQRAIDTSGVQLQQQEAERLLHDFVLGLVFMKQMEMEI